MRAAAERFAISIPPNLKTLERENLEVFRARPGEFSPRDAQDLMAYPFFSLAKSKRVKPIDFRMGEIAIKVEATPEHGMATIWDADVLIWAASQIVQAKDAGLRTSRLMAATPHEILSFCGRGVGARDYVMPRRRGLSAPTEVELVWIKGKIERWIRFGRPIEERILDRRRRVLVFLPGAIFAFVRWAANDFGTLVSRLDILRACCDGEPRALARGARTAARAARLGRHAALRRGLEFWAKARAGVVAYNVCFCLGPWLAAVCVDSTWYYTTSSYSASCMLSHPLEHDSEKLQTFRTKIMR